MARRARPQGSFSRPATIPTSGVSSRLRRRHAASATAVPVVVATTTSACPSSGRSRFVPARTAADACGGSRRRPAWWSISRRASRPAGASGSTSWCVTSCPLRSSSIAPKRNSVGPSPDRAASRRASRPGKWTKAIRTEAASLTSGVDAPPTLEPRQAGQPRRLGRRAARDRRDLPAPRPAPREPQRAEAVRLPRARARRDAARHRRFARPRGVRDPAVHRALRRGDVEGHRGAGRGVRRRDGADDRRGRQRQGARRQGVRRARAQLRGRHARRRGPVVRRVRLAPPARRRERLPPALGEALVRRPLVHGAAAGERRARRLAELARRLRRQAPPEGVRVPLGRRHRPRAVRVRPGQPARRSPPRRPSLGADGLRPRRRRGRCPERPGGGDRDASPARRARSSSATRAACTAAASRRRARACSRPRPTARPRRSSRSRTATTRRRWRTRRPTRSSATPSRRRATRRTPSSSRAAAARRRGADP